MTEPPKPPEPTQFPAPIPPPAPVRDEAKIDIVRGVLERLESGEQFTALAILLADGKRFEGPYDGWHFELLTAAARFMHRINLKMDETVEE